MKYVFGQGPQASAGKRRAALIAGRVGVLLLLLFLSAQKAVATNLDPLVTLDIDAGSPLDQALLNLATQANMFLTTRSATGYVTEPIKGTYTVTQALKQLLEGSGLSYKIIDLTIYIFRSEPSVPTQADAVNANGPPAPAQRQRAPKLKSVRRERASETTGEGNHDLDQVLSRGTSRALL